MSDIILFVYLFVQIFLLVILGIILYNTNIKSYKPHSANIFTIVILIAFGVNGFVATNSVRTLIASFNSQINQILTTPKNEQKSTINNNF